MFNIILPSLEISVLRKITWKLNAAALPYKDKLVNIHYACFPEETAYIYIHISMKLKQRVEIQLEIKLQEVSWVTINIKLQLNVFL